MKALIQRVAHASVSVDQEVVGKISCGILLLVGFEKSDTVEILDKMANKILAYRIFSDQEGKMNLSLADIDGELLVISQFTLAAATNKGLRPSFSAAAPPLQGRALYEQFIARLESLHGRVATGQFGAHMDVSLLNDGPVTFLLAM